MTGRRGLSMLIMAAMTRFAIPLLLALSMPVAAGEMDIVGNAIVTDGDSLLVRNTSIRLCGIDGVEKGDPGFEDALHSLRGMTRFQEVRCVPVGQGTVCDERSKPTTYHRTIAQCFVGEIDLAAEMVRLGHACAWPVFSGDAYVDLGCVTDRETTNAVTPPSAQAITAE